MGESQEETRRCPECGVLGKATAKVFDQETTCFKCGEKVLFVPTDSDPAASQGIPPPPDEGEPEVVSTIIPYRNAPALVAFCLGVCSILPCIGFFLAVPALILGIIGLKRGLKNPAAEGKVHALIGIIAGSIFTIVWGVVWLWALYGSGF